VPIADVGLPRWVAGRVVLAEAVSLDGGLLLFVLLVLVVIVVVGLLAFAASLRLVAGAAGPSRPARIGAFGLVVAEVVAVIVSPKSWPVVLAVLLVQGAVHLRARRARSAEAGREVGGGTGTGGGPVP